MKKLACGCYQFDKEAIQRVARELPHMQCTSERHNVQKCFEEQQRARDAKTE